MNEYEPASENTIGAKAAYWLREKLLKAQARIEQLDEEGHILHAKLREAQASSCSDRRVEQRRSPPDRRDFKRRYSDPCLIKQSGRRLGIDRRKS